MPAFKKILIANRGEIAVRIIRTLRALEIPSVVIFHSIDADSAACREADERVEVIGDSPVAAYLDIDAVVAACRATGADAVHPGYGFLAENPAFADALSAAGIAFIGPGPEAMALMGDKVRARREVARLGFPITPSADEEDDPASFAERAAAVGFPLLIKAAAGGGGRGMRIVTEVGGLADQIATARREAERYFGDGRLYVERYIERPRHIEVQVLADSQGHVVHLWERECSVQRRFQKIVEESPAPGLNDTQREKICETAVGIARAIGYVNAGTVEFLLGPDGTFSFMEMNTRLQVEHPVTEAITGLDLVGEQIRIAAGEALGYDQGAIVRNGHAIECRIYAEEPERDFAPAVGKVLRLRPPAGPGVRFDGGVIEGQAVTPAFDPMLAKVIVHAADRSQALHRARAALRDLVLLGVSTNVAFLERLLGHPAFAAGETHTGFLAEHREVLQAPPPEPEQLAALAAAAALIARDPAPETPQPYAAMGAWRN